MLAREKGDIHLDNKVCFYPDYSIELRHHSTEGIPQVVEAERVAVVSIFPIRPHYTTHARPL